MSVAPLCRRLFISTMDARSEQGQWLDRPMTELSRVSSADRGWAFAASLIRVAGGVSRPTVLARHNVTMLVGPALPTVARCDDTMAARLQRPGEFDILPASSSVTWVDQGDDSLFLAVGLEHELVRTTAFEMGLDPRRVSFTPRLTCRDPQIEHLLWALKAELESEVPYGRIYADSLGVALASQLLRRWWHLAPKTLANGLSDRDLKRVLAYIRDRLGAELTLAEIAEVANVSLSHFNVRFRQSMGTSVHQYVMRKRVERAAELLTRTQLPICDIALQAGFANQSHLALRMRRQIGLSPKALRQAR
ncbi:MAG TPA: AraC family transcriptional regulator [Candidatus Cybelea sp.]|jgi:AraC family transcriptional regulator